MWAETLMYAIAHGGVWTHTREPAMKVDFERKMPCHIGELNLHQQHASPTLYQLSYIPTPNQTFPSYH